MCTGHLPERKAFSFFMPSFCGGGLVPGMHGGLFAGFF